MSTNGDDKIVEMMVSDHSKDLRVRSADQGFSIETEVNGIYAGQGVAEIFNGMPSERRYHAN